MEGSDEDDLSFVSASDSETAADNESATPLKVPVVEKLNLPRPCSPSPSLISRSSFRRTGPKRPAPQPPSCPKAPATPSESQARTESTCSESLGATAVTMSIGAYASHPIVLVSSEEEAKSTPAAISVSSLTSKPSEGHGWSLTNLQLRHIDDVLEPLSRSLPLSSTITPVSSPTTSPSPPLASFTHFSPSFSSLSSITSSSFYQVPRPCSTASLPPGVSSFPSPNLGSAQNPYFLPPVPSQDSIICGSPIYAPVAPLSYLPQYGSHPSALRPPFFTNSYTAKADTSAVPVQDHLPNKLAHSASDPGVNQMIRSGYLMPPAGGNSLDRLSEADEDDDDGSYEEVFYRQEEKDSRSVIPVKPKRRRRLDRSDSVGVAHIYEDLLVSSRLNLKVTFTNITMVVIAAAFLMPNSAAILYNFFRLVFGTLFPAYYSYKAVRTKNVKEYVKWMMYWIVFAFFTCAETITDVFVSFWFPFYYEIKILVVLWLLSPATKGSSILYRKFVHPWLTKKEEEIDDCIAKAKQQGYSTVVQLGTKGVNYATNVIMQTALKGGGGLVNQLKRSYSASEIGEDTADHNRNLKALPPKETIQSPSEEDDISISSGSYESEPPRHRAESESLPARPRGHSTGRSVRSVKTRSADVSEVYFHDSTETIAQRRSPRTHDAGRTADGGTHSSVTRRSRSGEVSYATLPRTTKRTSVKKRQA